MASVAIIFPAYNEELTIEKTIHSFFLALPSAKIIVVDNNSNDKTASMALKTFKSLKCPGLVIFEPARGKGNAIRKAFSEIDADIYVVSDADMTYPADQIHELISPISAHKADMVVGDRRVRGLYTKENKRSFHNFGNSLVNLIIRFFFHSNLNDVMSGYRAISRKLVKNYPITVSGFQIETDLTLFALDKRFIVQEVPINYKDRPHGSFSKLNTISDGARVLFTIFQMLRFYKPLVFFSILSALFFILSSFVGYPVIYEFITTGVIHHLPLAILAASLMILSSMIFGIGLVLDSISHQNKMNFEFRMLEYINQKK
jgi:glycosyltransferase involved in cell wall biosynthesis